MLDILKSTAKSTVIYSFGNLSSRLAGFVLIPLYTSHLSVAEFGMMGVLEISSQIVISILGLGLYNAYFRWYWEEEHKRNKKSILYTILVAVVSLSIILFIPFYYSRSFIARFFLDSSEHSNLILLLFTVSFLETINIIIATLLRIKDKPGLFSILMFTKLIITLSLNIFFIVYQGKSIEGVYFSLIIGSIVYIILSISFISKEIEFNFQFKILKKMLKFSTPLLIVAITGVVLNTTDRFALKFLIDMDEVGKYSLGFKISNTIRVFIITSANMAIQPIIFKMIDDPNNKRFYSKLLTYYSFGLMFFVLGFSLFGKEIIKVLSKNPDYWSAYKIIPIISLSIFFTMLRDISLTGINITKKTFITARITIISVVINIILSIVFVSLFQSIGAAISVAISQFVFFILVFNYSQRVYFIPYEIKKLFLIVFVGIILFLFSTLLSESSLFVRLSIKSFLIFLFPIILYFMNFYEQIEIDRIKGFVRKWSKQINNK